MPHDRMLATRGSPTPGSTSTSSPAASCPRSRRSTRSPARDTTLRVADRLSFGMPLRRDAAAVGRGVPGGGRARCADLGFDETFRRMWHFYLEYSRAGLRLRLPRRAAAGAGAAGGPTTSRLTGSPAWRSARGRPAAVPAAATCRCGCAPGTAPRPARLDAPLVELRSPDAVRRMLWRPGRARRRAGLRHRRARRPTGDLGTALTHAFAVGRERGLSGVRPHPAAAAPGGPHGRRASARSAARRPLPSRRPGCAAGCTAGCATGARSATTTTSPTTSTRCCSTPSMAYSCGYWTSDRPVVHLGDAQRDKLDLVCRKLGLEPGIDPARRRLRLGIAVPARGRALRRPGHRDHDRRGAEGVHRRADPRTRAGRPGRDPAAGLPRGAAATGAYDAVGSIEMGEHVGEANYPTYVDVLRQRRTAGRPRAGPADVAAPAGIPAEGRSSSPSSRRTCTCGRSARPSRTSRRGASRCATCTPCASTTCAPSTAGSSVRGQPRPR